VLRIGRRSKQRMMKPTCGLVVSIAKNTRPGLEAVDLVQEGSLGLERAVEKI